VSPVLWLRAAACITALLAAGHLIGHPWTPLLGAEGQHVIDQMRSYHFDAMGFNRSYSDFYEGFGWMIGVFLLAHAVLFWQLASLARTDSNRLRPVVAIQCIEYALVAALGGRFLFWTPLCMSAAIAAALLLGWISLSVGVRPDATSHALKNQHKSPGTTG
jgi:hypothetical protein